MAGSPESSWCSIGNCPVDHGTRERDKFSRGVRTAAANKDWKTAADLERITGQLDDVLHEIVDQKDELCPNCRYHYSPLLERYQPQNQPSSQPAKRQP